MQFEAALVLEKPLFELESSSFVSISFEAIIKMGYTQLSQIVSSISADPADLSKN